MVEDILGSTWANSSIITNSFGMRIYAKINCNLSSVKSSSNCAANRCRLMDDTGTVLATSSVTNNIANFNYDLIASTYYRIELDSNGSTYQVTQCTVTPPVNCTNINFITGSLAGANYAKYRNLYSVITSTGPSDPTGLTITPSPPFSYSQITMNGIGSTGPNYRYKIYDVTTSTLLQDYSDNNIYQLNSSHLNHIIQIFTKGWDGSKYSNNEFSKLFNISLGKLTTGNQKQNLKFGNNSIIVVV